MTISKFISHLLCAALISVLTPGCISLPGEGDNAAAAPSTADSNTVLMVVELNGAQRNVVMNLNPAIAPNTVANFKKNIRDGVYDGLAFHRVIRNYIVQAGDPLTKDDSDKENWGTGSPGFTLSPEIKGKHLKGSVVMARLDDDINPGRESNGSQFFICLKDLPDLDGKYTVFGQVATGQKVIKDMSKVSTDSNDVPLERVQISHLRIIRPGSKFVEKPAPNPTESGGFIKRIW